MASIEPKVISLAKSVELKVPEMAVESREEKINLPASGTVLDGSLDIANTVEKNKNTNEDTTNSIENAVTTANCDNTKNKNEDDVILLENENEKNQFIIKKNDVQTAKISELNRNNDSEVTVFNNSDNAKETPSKKLNIIKRKRRMPNVQEKETSLEDNSPRTKRNKVKNTTDRFCWRCHKESAEAHCSACPRSWHRKCMGGMTITQKNQSFVNWICGECANILRAENAETRSAAMAQLSVDQLCLLLKHIVERMRDYPGSEPFWKPVDLSEVPNYLDYVVKPMDLSLLELNVKAKLYGSTDAFMADAKWIQHNCVVFNTCGGVYTDTSKLTNASKQIIKMARQEVSEIEACPDCFAHGRNLPRPQPAWFIEPCRRPHPLVWAKLKGFPFWPAKAMSRVNTQGFVDVRFFGEHDRAWVSPRDLYLYSQEPPAPLPRKRQLDMADCIKEITRHCRKLEMVFGPFKFAPPKTQYNPQDPLQIQILLPNYDPFDPNISVTPQLMTPKKKPVPKKRSLLPKTKSPNELETKESSDIENKTMKVCDSRTEQSDADEIKEEKKPDESELILCEDSNIIVKTSTNKSIKMTDKNEDRAAHKNWSKDIKTPKEEDSKPVVSTGEHTNRNSANKLASPERNNKFQKSANAPFENISKKATPVIQILHLSSKETNVKNSAVKSDTSQNLTSPQKAAMKAIRSVTKVYKPKTRMVDKVNAEKALNSVNAKDQNLKTNTHTSEPLKDTQKLSDLSTMSPYFSVTNSKLQTTSSNIHSPTKNSTDQSVALLLLLNSGKPNSTNRNNDVSAINEAPMDSGLYQKKESKARKSFPNKPPTFPQVPESSLLANSLSSSVGDSLVRNSSEIESSFEYQMLPPEAGPNSARLYHGAQDLARRIAQLMEEAYKEAAEESHEFENNKTAHQATVHFLRLQMERMGWQHQQQLAELKHNTDRILKEMKASLEAERLRSIEEIRREAEEEKLRCIDETKRKQWCAMCGHEALFYCCWNTAYCDYPCQQLHWSTHSKTCAQEPSFATIVNNSASSSNQQQNHNAKVSSPAGRVYAISQSKLTEMTASLSLSYTRNEGNQESS